MTVPEVLREANRIADKKLEIFHRAMSSLQKEQRRMEKMKVSMDKEYRTRDGEKVRLLCVDRKRPYAVVALVGEEEVLETFTAEAQHSSLNMHLNDLVEVTKWEDFAIDEPVMVLTDAKRWMKGHFAGVSKKGKPQTWRNGMTSWTTGSLYDWDECRRPTKEELAQ